LSREFLELIHQLKVGGSRIVGLNITSADGVRWRPSGSSIFDLQAWSNHETRVSLCRDYDPNNCNPAWVWNCANHDIGHLNIDKSPELHARVLTEVLTVLGRRLVTKMKPGSNGLRARSGLEAPVTTAAPGESKAKTPKQPIGPTKNN